jgi:hypothetical protein
VELLRGKRGVWLAAEISIAALTDTLLTAVGSLRQGQRFTHSWVEPFGMHRAIREYEDLIDRILVTCSQ